MNTKSASLAAAGTVLLWASAFPAITVAVRGLGPAGLAVARLAVASAVLALAAPWLGGRGKAGLMGVRRPRPRDLPLIALCGLAGMTGYQLLLNAGERVVLQGVFHTAQKPLLARYTGFEVTAYAMLGGHGVHPALDRVAGARPVGSRAGRGRGGHRLGDLPGRGAVGGRVRAVGLRHGADGRRPGHGQPLPGPGGRDRDIGGLAGRAPRAGRADRRGGRPGRSHRGLRRRGG